MTSRQFYIVLSLFVVSLKVQKLPCLMYVHCGKDSYLQVLTYMVVNLLLIMIAFFILKMTKKDQIFSYEMNQKRSIIIKLGMLFVALYFLVQATIFYEAVQDLFSHVLFDKLPWAVFSLLLVFCVFYLATSGINNVSRSFELYFFVIIFSYLIIAIFGALHTDFTVIFPLETISFKTLVDGLSEFNIWFGDFFIVLFLGYNAKGIKLKWTLLSYALSMMFVSFLLVEFNGIFKDFSPMQASLISIISEQAMLGLDIGRVDWFLILLTEVGTILCCGMCLHLVKRALAITFPKINSNYLLFAVVMILYFTDILFLVDTNIKERIFLGNNEILFLILKFVIFGLLFVFSCWKFFAMMRKNKTKKRPKENGV